MGKGSTDIPETKAEQMQAQVAMRRWNDYQTLFKPYENKFMRRVDAMNGEAEMNVASDLSMRPLANAFAKEGLKIRNSMMQNGVNPNSGRFQSGIREGETGLAGSKVDTASRGTSSQQDRYVSGIQNIVAMGQGQAGNAMQGLTDIASMAQQDAQNSVLNSMQNSALRQEVAGTAIGAGLRWGIESPTPPPKDTPTPPVSPPR
ncbi:hypothetical protein [Bowmanella sp. JS7-9]|uniref:Uncharacterized protein n=1 Tax=Pseudobowmanella zhangzhouensis TaxID=1537679 RepID=A0ABW1XPD1_9ALTE|nr:hypothetical protein [Bowmanella sp. JS7-9]TBX21936.1 hypothetical protein TK45_10640 [Bowmanella sp. JS7-9]